MKKKNSAQGVMMHITVGLQLGITIFLFVYLGHYLDKRYAKSPLFLIIGTALGMIIGFYHLMKELQEDTKKEDDNEDSDKKKVKWK